MPLKEGDKGLDQLINNETPMWALMHSHDKSTSRLKKALIATNTAYKICKSVQEMDKLGTESPIFYGNAQEVAALENSGLLYFNRDQFNYKKVVDNNLTNMLNWDCKEVKISSLMWESQSFFIRPTEDLKTFNGTLMKGFDDDNHTYDKAYIHHLAVSDPDKKVIVASPKKIHAEYRSVLIDNKLIDVVQYMCDGELNFSLEVSQKLRNTIQSFCYGLITPSPLVVCDLCDTINGLKVLEFNCFHASDFYHLDLEKVVKEVNNFHLMRHNLLS
jgi:hypothetical protein